jgi:hypothetical protein
MAARLDRFEERPHRFQLVAVQHLRGACGVVEVPAEDVPAGEDQVVERCQRHEIANQRRVGVGALAQPNVAHLGERADRLGEAAAYGLDSGDQRGGDRPHAGNHDAKFSTVGLDAGRGLRSGWRCGGGC